TLACSRCTPPPTQTLGDTEQESFRVGGAHDVGVAQLTDAASTGPPRGQVRVRRLVMSVENGY
ncbi:MAG TPA: hypothetical protein VHK24_07855, partial [Steroidobacter sp.]|nr:hypothetical protein [Steroidobacter sp.]